MPDGEWDNLDALLDRGLRGYADAEPRLGFEQRITRRIRAESRVPRRVWRWWIALPVVFAGIALAIVLAPEPSRPAPVVAPPPSPPPLAAYKPAPPKVVVVQRRKPKAAPRKRMQFPSPVKMTGEERALAEFVAKYPQQALEIAKMLQSPADKPIVIEPIEIKPLDNGS